MAGLRRYYLGVAAPVTVILVIPAQAGNQCVSKAAARHFLGRDPRLRGDDKMGGLEN